MTGRGILREGAALLWRRQRVLWWLFGVDLLVGLIASLPFRSQLTALNASVSAQAALYHDFNLFRLDEALTRPDAPHGGVQATAAALTVSYFVFLLFAIGGVIESLYTDTTPRFSQFLSWSAAYFWRMVRLAILFGVLLLPILTAQSGIGPLTDWIGNHSSSERLIFTVSVAAVAILALVALAVRVWIDLAQVDCVAHERRAVRRSFGRSLRILRGGFWRVYGAILAIQLSVAVISFALMWLWTKLPHEAIGRTFLVGQIIVFSWIGARLWQKATEIVLYHQREFAETTLLQEVAPTIDASPVIVADPTPDVSI